MNEYIPNIYQKSIYTIDYSKLFNKNIKCLLFDLDNTILPTKSNEIGSKTKDLFISLKQKGFTVIILSNSLSNRVKPISDYLSVDAYSFSLKPFSRNFVKIMKKYDFKEEEMAIIGDQLYTDIKGGNKVGITTILVNPLSNKDNFFSTITRSLENRKIKELENNNLLSRGIYYDNL